MTCNKIIVYEEELKSFKYGLDQLGIFLRAYRSGNFRLAKSTSQSHPIVRSVAGDTRLKTLEKIEQFLSSRLLSMVEEFSDLPSVKDAWFFAFSLANPDFYDYFKGAYNAMKRGNQDGANRWKILIASSLQQIKLYKIDVLVRAHSSSELVINSKSTDEKTRLLNHFCSYVANHIRAKYRPNIFSVKRHRKQRDQSSAQARVNNISNTYSISTKYSEDLSGKKVLIFDDNKSSGATIREIARVLTERYPNIELYILALTKGRKPQQSMAEIDRKKEEEKRRLINNATTQLKEIYRAIELLPLSDFTAYYLQDSDLFLQAICQLVEVTDPVTIQNISLYVDCVFLDSVWFETPPEEDPEAFNLLLQDALALNQGRR